MLRLVNSLGEGSSRNIKNQTEKMTGIVNIKTRRNLGEIFTFILGNRKWILGRPLNKEAIKRIVSRIPTKQ